MKATCPRCGTKAAHEMVVSVVRTWFRCVNCTFVWRGTLLSLAFARVPLGSTFRDEDATVPLTVPAAGPVALGDIGLTGGGAPTAPLRETPAPPVRPAEAHATRQSDAGPPEVTVASHEPQDVQSWLDSVEERADPSPQDRQRRPVDPEPEIVEPSPDQAEADRASELGRWFEMEPEVPGTDGPPASARNAPDPDEIGDWLTVDEITVAPPRPSPSATETQVHSAPADVPTANAEVPVLPASAPDAQTSPPALPKPVPPAALDTVPQDASKLPGLSQLDQLLSQLEALNNNLSQIEERLHRPDAEPSSGSDDAADPLATPPPPSSGRRR